MPQNTYLKTSKGEWDAIELRPFSSAGILDANFNIYQFIIWTAYFELITVPLRITRNLKYFGEQYYLGEVAYLHFGRVVETFYLRYKFQQTKVCVALPVPLFDATDSTNYQGIGVGSNFQNLMRARSLIWDLEDGVEVRLTIDWQFAGLPYDPQIHILKVI